MGQQTSKAHSNFEEQNAVSCGETSNRRLHDANRVGLPPAVHAVTEVLNLDIKPSNSQKGFHRFKATATSSGASAETRTRRRFFLTTPEIKAAIRRYLGCTDVIGLELALYQSGPRCKRVVSLSARVKYCIACIARQSDPAAVHFSAMCHPIRQLFFFWASFSLTV